VWRAWSCSFNRCLTEAIKCEWCLQDTARINAGRTPHAFFARRAAQADIGAATVKLVTELTEPPLPPIHLTQVSWTVSDKPACHPQQQPRCSLCAPGTMIHVVYRMLQANATALTHSTPETATFRLEAAPAGVSAAEENTAANISFALCNRPSNAANCCLTAPPAAAHPASRSLLQELAQQLADAERLTDGGGNPVSCSCSSCVLGCS
jgi:hypothetical protein